MYSKILSCVKTERGLTESFRCNVGTRQGDCSSRTIFSLFIYQLCTKLREGCRNEIFINKNMQDIVCLMFADDIANCSDTVINLQNQLNIINHFCSDTGIEINLSKTEVIVFRNSGPLKRNEKWFLGKESVKTSSVTNIWDFISHPRKLRRRFCRSIIIKDHLVTFHIRIFLSYLTPL